MMVPTGSAFLATSTFGPTGTAGAALAWSAPAPVNMFLAMMAVTTAMTSAPTSSATFLTSMAITPPQWVTQLPSDNPANWLRKRWASNHIPPTAMATP